MNKFTNNQIRNMKAYKPPLEGRAGDGVLRLDFNERTIPVSKKIVQALKDFACGDIIGYPEYGDLCTKIASYSNTKEDQVMITNGSDQGMDVLFRTFTKKGDKVIIPSPSFAMYYQCAQLQENEILKPDYDENGNFPLNEVIGLIDEDTSLVVICNPNNPTGTLIPLDDIEKILKKALEYDAMVYVDEAYYEFSKITAAGLVDKYPNLIITRTFSKAFGLPSLRIGYTISCKENIEEMLKVRGPYDVNMAGVVAARAALDEIEDMSSYVSEVMNDAKPMVEKFFDKVDISYLPSSANFILFKPSDQRKVCEALKSEGILVRPRSGPNIKETIRVCIGTVNQMQRFINIYKSILN